MNILGMGPVELLVIVVIALLVLGPERLASNMRTFGKLSREFRNRNASLRRTIQELLDEPWIPPGANRDGAARPDDVRAHPEAQPRRRAPARKPEQAPSGDDAPPTEP